MCECIISSLDAHGHHLHALIPDHQPPILKSYVSCAIFSLILHHHKPYSMVVDLFLYIPIMCVCLMELVKYVAFGVCWLLLMNVTIFFFLFLKMSFAYKLCWKHSYHVFLSKTEKLLLIIVMNQEWDFIGMSGIINVQFFSQRLAVVRLVTGKILHHFMCCISYRLFAYDWF